MWTSNVFTQPSDWRIDSIHGPLFLLDLVNHGCFFWVMAVVWSLSTAVKFSPHGMRLHHMFFPGGGRLGHLFWLCAMKVIQWITNVWVSNQENEKRWQNLSLCWVWADGTTWPPYRSDQAAVRQLVRDQKGNTQMRFCRNSLMYLFFTFAERLSTYGFVYSAGIFINK